MDFYHISATGACWHIILFWSSLKVTRYTARMLSSINQVLHNKWAKFTHRLSSSTSTPSAPINALVPPHIFPGRFRVHSGPDLTSSLSVLKGFSKGSILATLTNEVFAVSKVKRYSTVQVAVDTHVELNCELLYMNHSCDPSVDVRVLNAGKLEDLAIQIIANKDLNIGDEGALIINLCLVLKVLSSNDIYDGGNSHILLSVDRMDHGSAVSMLV